MNPEIGSRGSDITQKINEIPTVSSVSSTEKAAAHAQFSPNRRFESTGLRPERPRLRFQGSTIDEMFDSLTELADQAYENSDSSFEVYKKIIQSLPERIPTSVHEIIEQAALSPDPEKAYKGKTAFIYIHLRTILTVVTPFINGDSTNDTDILDAAIVGVFSRINESASQKNVPSPKQVHTIATRESLRYLSIREVIPTQLANDQLYEEVGAYFDRLAHAYPLGIPEHEVLRSCNRLSTRYGIYESVLKNYFEMRQTLAMQSQPDNKTNDPSVNFEKKELQDTFSDILLSFLSPTEKDVITMLYGFDCEVMTSEQVARNLGTNTLRINLIHQKALRKMRHPRHKIRLRSFLG